MRRGGKGRRLKRSCERREDEEGGRTSDPSIHCELMCTAEAARSKIWLQPRRLATSWTFELPQTWVIKPTMTTSLWLHMRAASHSRRVHNSAANNRSMFKGKISSERWATRTLEFISRPTTFVPSSPDFAFKFQAERDHFAYDHTALKIRHPVRSGKSSSAGPG